MIEQYNTLAEKFLRKWFWLYFFSFIIWPIWYITKITLTYSLSVNEVWIIYWIIALLWLLMVFNDFWMSESIKYFIPKFLNENRYDKVKWIILISFLVQILTAILIWLFFFFGADIVATQYFQDPIAREVLKIFSLYFVFLCISQSLENFFASVQDTFSNQVILFTRSVFTMLFILFIFFSENANILNYSYAWVFGLFISVFLTIITFYKKYYWKYFKNQKMFFEKSFIKEIFTYSILVFLWASASTILSQIDMQMIIYLLWTEDAGYYTAYLSIINIPFMLIWPILGFLFPVFSELYAKKDIEKIKFTRQVFTKMFLLIWIMFNLFFFVFAWMLAYTIFWVRFLTSGLILQYSILLLIFNYLLQINFNLMAWIWKVKERVWIIVKAIIFNFIMNLILIKFMWVVWASLATGMWWILIWALSELKIWKKFKISIDWKAVIKNLILFSLLWFLCFKYFLIDFDELARVKTFFLLWAYFFVWCVIFLGVNWRDCKVIFWEIKKLKKV
jgi:O-antigen/teichoic acid export membrane protein